jgi:hypothetical protein
MSKQQAGARWGFILNPSRSGAFFSELGPVRVKKTRQIKNSEPRSDSIGTEEALA